MSKENQQPLIMNTRIAKYKQLRELQKGFLAVFRFILRLAGWYISFWAGVYLWFAVLSTMESLSNILRNDIIGLVVFVVSVMMPFFLFDVVVPIVFPRLCPKCGSYFYKTETDYLTYDD